jgi:hypothetical protein
MRTYALDANCFINAVNPASISYYALRLLFDAAKRGKVSLKVSLQTLHELEVKRDKAWQLANNLSKLPHWPIGTWNEQVGTWKEATGTWNDGIMNDEIQTELEKLAKSGTDIRDRGAYIDALRSELDGFITSDKQLVGSGPAERINNRFSTRVLTPEQLVTELGL